MAESSGQSIRKLQFRVPLDKKIGRDAPSRNPSPSLETRQHIPGGFFHASNLDPQNPLPFLTGIVDVMDDLRGIVVRCSFAELRNINAEGRSGTPCSVD